MAKKASRIIGCGNNLNAQVPPMTGFTNKQRPLTCSIVSVWKTSQHGEFVLSENRENKPTHKKGELKCCAA